MMWVTIPISYTYQIPMIAFDDDKQNSFLIHQNCNKWYCKKWRKHDDSRHLRFPQIHQILGHSSVVSLHTYPITIYGRNTALWLIIVPWLSLCCRAYLVDGINDQLEQEPYTTWVFAVTTNNTQPFMHGDAVATLRFQRWASEWVTILPILQV